MGGDYIILEHRVRVRAQKKICEEIIWGVGMGSGLENVQVWVQADSHVSVA